MANKAGGGDLSNLLFSVNHLLQSELHVEFSPWCQCYFEHSVDYMPYSSFDVALSVCVRAYVRACVRVCVCVCFRRVQFLVCYVYIHLFIEVLVNLSDSRV